MISPKTKFVIMGVILGGLIYFAYTKVLVEKFGECWCRADGGQSQSQGDLTPHLRRFAQILTNSKYLVGREAGTSMLYWAPAPLKPDSKWTAMGGGLLGNIALSDRFILGTNRDGGIYAADLSAATDAVYSAPAYYQIPGGALQVAVAEDKFFVLNAAGEIYSAPASAGAKATWTKLNGAGYDIGYDAIIKKLVLRGTDNKRYLCDFPCNTGSWTQS